MNKDFNYYLLKFKAEIGMLLFSFFTFLTPVHGMIILVGCFVFFDTTAGVYIARKNKDYQSHKLFNMVIKTFFYMTTIILAYLIDVYIFEKKIAGVDFLSSKIVSMFWIYIEAKSLDEKSQKLGNRPFHVIMNSLIKRVKAWKKDINEIKD